MNEANDEMLPMDDLGDATVETKQVSPIGPMFDSYFGRGWM